MSTPVNCDDGVDCTVDSCDVATGCQNAVDDALCDDGDVCTEDVCNAINGCENTLITPGGAGSTGFDASVLPGEYNFFDNTTLAQGVGPFSVVKGSGAVVDTEADGSTTILNIFAVTATLTYRTRITLR